MNEQWFNEIHIQYANKIRQYAYRLAGIKEVAEDVCQDVFAKVWEKRSHVCEISELENYLLKMTKNLCINQFRKIFVRKRASDYFRHLYNDFYFDDAVVTKEYEQTVYEAVQRLTLKEKAAFTYHEAGYDRKKIAAIMEVSKNTTDNQLKTAKKKIRKYISGKFNYTVKNAA